MIFCVKNKALNKVLYVCALSCYYYLLYYTVFMWKSADYFSNSQLVNLRKNNKLQK